MAQNYANSHTTVDTTKHAVIAKAAITASGHNEILITTKTKAEAMRFARSLGHRWRQNHQVVLLSELTMHRQISEDPFTVVDGGLVQNDPALPVYDFDVLDTDAPQTRHSD